MIMKESFNVTNQMAEDYASISSFVKKYNGKIDFVHFDYYTVNEAKLFSIRDDFDFDALQRTLYKIIAELSPIKRIFSKPLIHLKDQDVILPVESVHKINNETVIHLASHSELWENFSKDGVKPRKLKTVNNQDNYSIYENIAFTRCIDTILNYTGRNLRQLYDFIYSSKLLEFKPSERIDHLSYYLAIGKLHTGYIRDFVKNYAQIDSCINAINSIRKVITSRLHRPVYQKNTKYRNDKFVLRKTNILKMHKDYKRIYALLRYFQTENISYDGELPCDNLEEFNQTYFWFCELLTIFSVSHFNFLVDERSGEEMLDFDNLNLYFNFVNLGHKHNSWTLSVETVIYNEVRLIQIDVKKNKTYRIALVPEIREDELDKINDKLEGYKASKIIIATPFEGFSEGMYISSDSINSFRRIQQAILRAMVYSDEDREVCAFCGDELELMMNENGGAAEDENGNYIYYCSTCRQQIRTVVCPVAKNAGNPKSTFFATTIKGYKQYVDSNKRISFDQEYMFNRQVEEQMHFRNITKITSELDIVCPFCGKVHVEQKDY